MKTILFTVFCFALMACISRSQQCPPMEPRTIFVRFVAASAEEWSIAEESDAGGQTYLDASIESEETNRFDPLNGDL
jgi:hypothetical protein